MGSRDATRFAFKFEIILNGEAWMDMIKTRNKAVHTYDEATAKNVIDKTALVFYPLFNEFKVKMQNLADEQ